MEYKVKSLEIDGLRASATIVDEEGHERYIRTNGNGEGLWVNGQQVSGTCQFSVNGMSKSGIYKKFRKVFT